MTPERDQEPAAVAWQPADPEPEQPHPAAPAVRHEEAVESEPAPSRAASRDDPHAQPAARTRLGSLWAGIIAFTIVLVLLLIFVLENLGRVEVSYLGFSARIPLGAAMLFAAVTGVLLAAIAGGLRILQLRRRLKRAAH